MLKKRQLQHDPNKNEKKNSLEFFGVTVTLIY